MATTALRRPILPPLATLPMQQPPQQTIYHPSSSSGSQIQPHQQQPPRSRLPTTQCRGARFIKQPRRPYMFTQLVQLSDGSCYTCRTTSPQSLYRSQKDRMNNLLWQPTNKGLANVELDEAGKLAAFRERYGRGWDLGKLKGDDDKDDKRSKTRLAAPSPPVTTTKTTPQVVAAPAADAAAVPGGGRKGAFGAPPPPPPSPVVGMEDDDGRMIVPPAEKNAAMSESAFEEEFELADLLKNYADQSGQDFSAVKGGGRKKKSKK